MDKPLKLGTKEYKSRLIVGTGKYPTLELMKEALEASGAEVYPNPAVDRLTVKFNCTSPDTYSIRVIDLLGEIVLSQEVKAIFYVGDMRLLLSEFQPFL